MTNHLPPRRRILWRATTALLLSVLVVPVTPLLLYGCTLSDDLCEESETCVNDGLFGQCFSPLSGAPPPTVLENLDDAQLELLQLEVTRLAHSGYEWPDEKAQCVFAYFKISMAYELQYDPTFCDVRSPANIWALIQLVDIGLKTPAEVVEESEPPVLDEVSNPNIELPDVVVGDLPDLNQSNGGIPNLEADDVLPVPDIDQGALQKRGLEEPEQNDTEEVKVVPVIVEDVAENDVGPPLSENDVAELIQELNEPAPEINEQDLAEFELDNGDIIINDPVVQEYVNDIIEGGSPDLAALTNDQLNNLIATVYAMKEAYDQKEALKALAELGEAEEAVPLDDNLSQQQADILKKDIEHLGETRLGLENVPHNIVKGKKGGKVSRVVGNRVYLKVNIKDQEQLYPLIEFLQKTIAVPNGLIFDDFQFAGGQLSLRIGRAVDLAELAPKGKNEKRIDTVEEVAQAVYKRRKDIARLSGAEVAETGIGIGEESVPVESADRDWLLMPVLFVCAFTITALVSVLAVHFYRQKKNYKNNITSIAAEIEGGKAGQAYQELCRQRMSQDADRPSGSKTSSTSSWCEDGQSQPNIDISTGHVLLNFLQEYINDSKRMEAQWEGLKAYINPNKHTETAERHMNMNRDVVPYDENLVDVDAWKDDEPAYLNASFVYDDDPRQAMYIGAQTPTADQIAAWWQAVWQHEVCLIVNISTLEEQKSDKTYWPAQGSEVHGAFEVHLVSEHIWSDDYIVRSFYLKNLRNSQTRTITQFHYLSWKKGEVPAQAKTLLEFRRKVNRSYRGRSAPILVHSNDGAGRTGTYCTVDMLCARITKGVKELDVVASVEHVRDQRPGLVATEAQFKMIYSCVAQEINTLLKALPQ